ncbi:MAG: chorismate mutase [bacterium]|nr:chorismate mutase [bacterium]
MDIEDWRKKIDELNAQILDLLNRRAECALEVGKLKEAAGKPIYAPEREMAVLNALRELNAGPLSHEAVQRIFQQIIDEARRLEQDHGGK